MTKEQRPTRPKQISTCEQHCDVLCEDGSIWHYTGGGDWECILEAHKEPVEEEPPISKKETTDKLPEIGDRCINSRTGNLLIVDRIGTEKIFLISDKRGNPPEEIHRSIFRRMYLEKPPLKKGFVADEGKCEHCHSSEPHTDCGKNTTHKLPEVGKRYRRRHGKFKGQEIKALRITLHDVFHHHSMSTPLLGFFDLWEELPDQEPTKEELPFQIEKDPDYSELLIAAKFIGDFFEIRAVKEWEFMGLKSRFNKEKHLSKEVQEASKELKDLLEVSDSLFEENRNFYIKGAAQKLVNALEVKQDKPEGEE